MPEVSNLYISSIIIEGNRESEAGKIRQNSGLLVGKRIVMEDLQEAIKNLWAMNLFSDIQIFASSQSENELNLIIKVEELPRLRKVRVEGNEEIDTDEIMEFITLYRGMVISLYKLFKIRHAVKKLYLKEGFLLAEVNVDTVVVKPGIVDLQINIAEGKKVQIELITFHGNQSFEEDEIKDMMEDTNEDTWWSSSNFNQKKYDEDLERIIQYYQNNGYRDATILRDSIYYSEDKQYMFIDIWIDEGIKYFIGKIDFVGNLSFTDEQLNKYIDFNRGDIYNYEKIKDAVQENLASLYYDSGYIYSTIIPQEIPSDRDTVDIRFSISEGKVSKIRNIEIRGNTFTKEKVVRRELQILPGQTFNQDLLVQSQRELWMLNYFSKIEPSIKPVDDENIDIVFDIEEKVTLTANMSAGWSKQDGFLGGLGLGMKNFMGNGQNFSIDANIGQYSNSYSINFTEPWLFDTPTLGGLGLYYNQRSEDIVGYRQLSMGGTLRLGRKLRWPDDYFRIDLIYKFDKTEFSHFSQEIIDENLNGIATENWPLTSSSITQVLTRNSLDRADFPTSGSQFSLTNEIAGGILGGNVNFNKHHFSMDWYLPLPSSFVLKSNFQTGMIFGFGSEVNIPYMNRFFMGGSGMSQSIALRGYDDPLTNDSDNRLGGESMIKYSLELRFPVIKDPLIYALTFAEAGETWEAISQTDPFNLRRSAGFGLRINVPMIGIVGLDYAYGFDYYDIASGERSGKWMFHFVFGKQF
jgi:outer membrane protein insertion porin family